MVRQHAGRPRRRIVPQFFQNTLQKMVCSPLFPPCLLVKSSPLSLRFHLTPHAFHLTNLVLSHLVRHLPWREPRGPSRTCLNPSGSFQRILQPAPFDLPQACTERLSFSPFCLDSATFPSRHLPHVRKIPLQRQWDGPDRHLIRPRVAHDHQPFPAILTLTNVAGPLIARHPREQSAAKPPLAAILALKPRPRMRDTHT